MKITLYSIAPAWGVANISPACLKLETWLRMAEVPYEIAPLDIALAPKGKMPFVRIDDEIMGDSTLIIERLSKELGKDLDADLSPAERAVSLAFRRMMKEHLYWVMVVDRWCNEENFAVYGPMITKLFFGHLPPDQQQAYTQAVRQQMIAQAQAQGMGRHTHAEVTRMGMADMQAISDYLGDKPFFFGDKPTLVDATLYGHVANILCVEFSSPLREFSLGLSNLVAYRDRLRRRWYSLGK